jgi:hypothetical protein
VQRESWLTWIDRLPILILSSKSSGARRLSLRLSFSGWATRTHLSDDETVAKMGHPNLDVGHPSTPIVVGSDVGHPP